MILSNATRLLQIIFAATFCSLLIACKSPYKTLQTSVNTPADCISKFKPHFTRTLYSAQVQITNHDLSGLLLIKEMPDSSTRLVFTQNSGFKFFDFEFAKDGNFTVHYLLDKMDKKSVRKTLQSDFATLLMLGVEHPDEVFTNDSLLYHKVYRAGELDYFITDKRCANFVRAEKTGGKKPKMTLTMQEIEAGVPSLVNIDHHNFNFHITLHKLEQ